MDTLPLAFVDYYNKEVKISVAQGCRHPERISIVPQNNKLASDQLTDFKIIMGGELCKPSKDTKKYDRMVMMAYFGYDEDLLNKTVSEIEGHLDKIKACQGKRTSAPVYGFKWWRWMDNFGGRRSRRAVNRRQYDETDVLIFFIERNILSKYVRADIYPFTSNPTLSDAIFLLVLQNDDEDVGKDDEDEAKDDSETTQKWRLSGEEFKKFLEDNPVKLPNQDLEIIDSTMLDENMIERVLMKVADRRRQKQQSESSQVSASGKKEALAQKLTKIWKAAIFY